MHSLMIPIVTDVIRTYIMNADAVFLYFSTLFVDVILSNVGYYQLTFVGL